MGLVTKTTEVSGGVKFSSYKAYSQPLKNREGVLQNLEGGSLKNRDNNIDIDNIDNNIDNNIYSDFEQVIKQKYLGKKTKAIRDKVVPKLLKKYSVEELTRCLDRYALECRGREKKYIMNESTFWNGRYIDYLDCNYEDNNTGKARVAATKKPKLSDF